MKKNDWIFALSLLVYSFLFWEQAPGLNFLLMNAVLLAGIVLKDASVLRNRNWWLSAAGAFVTAGSVAWYGDPFSVFANCVSLLLVSSFVVNRNNSLLVALLQSGCNMFASFAYMIVDGLARAKKTMPSQEGGRFGKRLLIVLLALIVVLIFFFLYRSSNVLFDKLTEKINFDFISFPWIVFMLAGALVLYGYYYHHPLPGVSERDAAQPADLQPSEKLSWFDSLMSVSSEKFSGIVLLSLLNALLLIVNTLDASFLFGGATKLPEGVTYTEYVHQGVGMLIVSIVFAMAIILYYFRGRLNFIEKSGALRTLAIIWILQNAFMLFSTACRNEMYVEMYGFTYKRLGVYFYLLLALIGLLTTTWKVLRRKTNAYLFRVNAWLFYAVMIFAAPVNWDGMIAHYNFHKAVQSDAAYVATLSWRAYPELVSYYEHHPAEPFPDDLKSDIFAFLSRQRTIETERQWPSKVLGAKPIYEELLRYQQFGKHTNLEAPGRGLKKLCFFPAFASTTYLNLSGNDLEDLGEAGKYSEVQILLLNNNKALVSLEGIGGMTKLKELRLVDTAVRDYAPLLKLNGLESLRVEWINDEWREKLRARFPKISIDENSWL